GGGGRTLRRRGGRWSPRATRAWVGELGWLGSRRDITCCARKNARLLTAERKYGSRAFSSDLVSLWPTLFAVPGPAGLVTGGPAVFQPMKPPFAAPSVGAFLPCVFIGLLYP